MVGGRETWVCSSNVTKKGDLNHNMTLRKDWWMSWK